MDKVIDDKRYIEIKKSAYQCYDYYNKLDRKSRKAFLEMLPPLENDFAKAIFRNTLLFPDTERLLSTTDRKELLNVLQEIYEKEYDGITFGEIGAKMKEYDTFGTRKLVQDGILVVMDELSYPDKSIGKKEYVSLKQEALGVCAQFRGLSLKEKCLFFEKSFENITYQDQIQIATVLIPDDGQLIRELQEKSVGELAEKYKVPESIINFKQEEYNRQDTEELIQQNEFVCPKNKLLWCGNIDEFAAGILEEGHYKKVYNVLDEKFSEYRKKVTK